MKVKTGYKVWLVAVWLLTGCYSKQKEETGIFHYNEFNGIASLDPAFAKSQSVMWGVHQLYNTLVEMDDSLHLVPSGQKLGYFGRQNPLYFSPSYRCIFP